MLSSEKYEANLMGNAAAPTVYFELPLGVYTISIPSSALRDIIVGVLNNASTCHQVDIFKYQLLDKSRP